MSGNLAELESFDNQLRAAARHAEAKRECCTEVLMVGVDALRPGARPGSRGDSFLDADYGVKGGFAAAERKPLTPWSASKKGSPRDPGRTINPFHIH